MQKKKKTQSNESKKKRKIILLSTLIPVGAAAVATAIAVPLVLKNKKKDDGGSETGKVTDVEWKDAFDEANYLTNTNSNYTINLNTKEFSEGQVDSELTIKLEVVNQKYCAVENDEGTISNSYGVFSHGVDISLEKNSSNKYFYSAHCEEVMLPMGSVLQLLSKSFSSAIFDETKKAYVVDNTYVVTFENKKLKQLDFAEGTEEEGYTTSATYDKRGSTTLSSYPAESDIINNIITSNYDETTHTWTSESMSAMPAEQNFVFVFNVKDKLLAKNSIQFASTSGNVKKSNLKFGKTFIMQYENDIPDNRVDWSSDEKTLTFKDDQLINDVVFVNIELKTGITDTNVSLKFTTAN